MDRMRLALKPGGQLVTYCSKGDVRRAMEEAGFVVDKIPGPPGKREMLRATKPENGEGRFNVRVYMIVTRNNSSGGQDVLISYERLPLGGVMKFPGGGLEWGEGTTACLRREALEELGQPVNVERLVHVSRRAHISSFDSNQQVLAVHYAARLTGEVMFEDDGEMEDVYGKNVPMMHQRLGWRDVESIEPAQFRFASDREAWEAWRQQC
jgi:ADP-ribose pyrophosphatase YjhB (NUDIX family)